MNHNQEIWKSIDGFSKYEISNKGRVLTHNWYGSGRTMVMKPGHDPNGYYRTMIVDDNGKNHTIKLHRVVAQAFIPNPHNYPHINHINCVRDDNRVENLEWCTPKQNARHAMKYGAFHKCLFRGSSNGNSKLTESEVLEIRRKYKPRIYSLNRLADEYGVSKKLILLIIQNKVWRHALNL